MKIGYLSLLLSCSIAFSQLSKKHWIPPLHARDASVVAEQFIYLSTPEPVPFAVAVTDGNGVPIAGSPFTISQGNPQMIAVGTGQGASSSVFLTAAELNIPTSSKGLILSAQKDFYTSYRVRSTNHAEILVGKGIPGLGTAFRVGSLPQNAFGDARNFVTSFMATEDNTVVTVSDYNTDVVFAGGGIDTTADLLTFNLNAGQSVVLSGYANIPANLDGFVGALVTSNLPIIVNTGNALAGMSNPNDGQDFTLDQIVGVEQVGTEYIVVRGNGSVNVERPLVIATEDNTSIFINGSTTAVATINAGDYYLVDSGNYQGTNNQNMYIETSKKVYVYQIIGGSTFDATSGLNFIPPLSCFFQKSVDMIPSVDSIGSTFYTGNLIVLTYANAVLTLNGNPVLANPEPVLGNTDWVTYRINNVLGDAAIVSTGPLAVGVFGASNAAGFGGYYSGFGSEPRDTEVAVCSNTTTNLFDKIDGNPEPGGTWTPPLASGTDIFDPNIDAPGIYNYVYNGECAIIDVDITVTIEQAQVAGIDASLTVCDNDAPLDLFSLLGTNAIPGGTWSPNLTSNTNIYNPALDTAAVYTYTISGTDICPESTATVTVQRNNAPVFATPNNFILCDDEQDGNDTNGMVVFNLLSLVSSISNNQTAVNVSFHETLSDAQANTNSLPTNYYTTSKTIFVRATHSVTNCFHIEPLVLQVNAVPVINENITLKQCDTDLDAVTTFNLEQANSSLSTDSALTFSYFTNQNDAVQNTNAIVNVNQYEASNNSAIWVRVSLPNDCYKTTQVFLVVSTTQIPQTFSLPTIEECDDYINENDPDGDGFDYFNLTNASTAISNLFPSGQNLTITYYENEADALAETNALSNLSSYRNSIPNQQTLWVRIDSAVNNDCIGLGPFVTVRVNPLPQIDLGSDFVLCVDPSTGLGSQGINATPSISGNYSYFWTPQNPVTNAMGGQSAIFNVTTGGTYQVLVRNNTTGCENTDTITVTFSSEPETISIQMLTPAFSSGTASVEAVVTGGFGTYEYSIAGSNEWQSSPIFTTLPNGSFQILVRDTAQCGILPSSFFQTITYLSYFTPNNDGYHDVWHIKGLPSSFQAKVFIFDRYGKLLKELKQNEFGWDGTYNGFPLPSTDYWFKIEYTENNVRKEFRSHFALKR